MDLPTDGFGNRFNVLRLLSEGDHAYLYLALDTIQNVEVVIKVANEKNKERILAEFQILHHLQHPNIVQAIDLLYLDGIPCLIQSLAPGVDFLRWSAMDRSSFRIGLGAAAVLRALLYLHSRNIIYGNLKPNHLRVGPDHIGTLPAVHLIDFTEANAYCRPSTSGVNQFIAPEVVAGGHHTLASDLFSLGAILWQSLTDTPLPLDRGHRSLMAELPLSIKGTHWGEILTTLLHPLPECRPTISALRNSLEQITNRSLQLSIGEIRKEYFPDAPLIGRDTILNRLEQLIEQINMGRGKTLHLSGPGKSSMAQAACSLAKMAAIKVISSAEAISLATASSLINLETDRLKTVTTRIVDDLLHQSRSTPLLLNLDGCSVDDPVAKEIVIQLVRVIATEPESALLLIWTGDVPLETTGLWEELALGNLSPSQSAELIRGMLYAIEPPPWIEQVYPITGGDPRLIVSLIETQIEAGLPDELIIPRDPLTSIEKRLALLNESERQLLAVVAHSPRPVRHNLVKIVAPEGINALPSLLGKQMLLLDSSGIYPANVFIRQIAQRKISGEALFALHQRFNEALQAETPLDSSLLGYHLIAAGRYREGASLILQAAVAPAPEFITALEQASAQLPQSDSLWLALQRHLAKWDAAQGKSQSALDIALRVQASFPQAGALLQADVLLEIGQPMAALKVLSASPQEPGMANLLLARAHFLLGDYEKAVEQALVGKTATDLPPAITLQLENLAGLSLVYLGQEQQGLQILEQAKPEAQEQNHPEVLLRLLSSRGAAFQRLGHLTEAAQSYSQCLDLATRLGYLSLAASCTLNLGTLAHRQLDYETALTNYRRSVALANRARMDLLRAAAMSNEANLLLVFGAWNEADRQLQQAEEIGRKLGALVELGHISLYQAELNLRTDNFELAATYLHQAQNFFQLNNINDSDSHWLEMELYLKQQQLGKARRIACDKLNQLAQDHPQRWRAHLLLAQIESAEGMTSLPEAIQNLEFALTLGRRSPGCDRRWEIHALLSHAYQQTQSTPESIFHYQQFHAELASFRQQIPLAYRTDFDQHPEVQHAHQLVKSCDRLFQQTAIALEEVEQVLMSYHGRPYHTPINQRYRSILDCALQLTGAERGFILLKTEFKLQIAASCHFEGGAVKRSLMNYLQPVVDLVLSTGRSMVVSEVQEDERFKNAVDKQEPPIQSVLAVPLLEADGSFGVLYLDHRFKKQLFQPKHLLLIETLVLPLGPLNDHDLLQRQFAEQSQSLADTQAQLEQFEREREALLVTQSGRENKSKDGHYTSTQSDTMAGEEKLIQQYRTLGIIGNSKAMRELYRLLDRISGTDLPIYIYGESGTGKELIAHAIHHLSSRRDQPFVSINCGAIPPSLLESELFGYSRGAFTGAIRDRAGLFESAGRGTIFLDEVGDMPPEMQVKLLRVLQEGTFRRLGDEAERRSACRVLSASNKKLAELVKLHHFREDLFYRLNGLNLTIPPLRDRREDIPQLADYILAAMKKQISISPSAMAALLDYNWPGNIRELENELQRAALLSDQSIEVVSLSIPAAIKHSSMPLKPTGHLQKQLQNVERQIIQTALDEAQGNVNMAAKTLGLHRVALYRKIRSLKIQRSNFQS